MAAVVQAMCPGCKSVLRIPADWVDQPMRCKHCGMVIQAKEKPTAVPVSARTPVPPTKSNRVVPIAMPAASVPMAAPVAALPLQLAAAGHRYLRARVSPFGDVARDGFEQALERFWVEVERGWRGTFEREGHGGDSSQGCVVIRGLTLISGWGVRHGAQRIAQTGRGRQRLRAGRYREAAIAWRSLS